MAVGVRFALRQCFKMATILGIIEEDDSEGAIRVIQFASSSLNNQITRLYQREAERNPQAHVLNYVEETVPRYSDIQFREHYRMGIETFEELLCWITPSLPKDRGITPEKNLLATLWYIGNTETYRGVADRFGLSKGSLQRVVFRTARILVANQHEWIKWPTTIANFESIAEQFQERCNFPGVVAAVDGTHIKIPGPSNFRDAYINRNGVPSMQLQVACSKNLMFVDVFTGWPGSCHDSRIFKNSPLATKLLQLDPKFHILGDSAYALSSQLLVPFKNNGHLDDLQKKYNKAHSSTRVDVERSIGLLKGKWRKMKFLEMTNIEMMPEMIVAACVLHNFIIEKEGVDEDQIIMDDEYGDDIIDNDHPLQTAEAKRMEVARSL